jgi:CHAD domain-containing protein
VNTSDPRVADEIRSAREEVATTTSLTVVQETERKYEAADALELPNPLESLGLNGDVEEQVLTAVYYDTADLRLLRAGITLRRREGGPDPGWHMKLPAGRDSRDELRLPLGDGRRPPAKLVKLARAHTRGSALEPVAELTTHRRLWRLTEADGRELAELVDDHVVACTLGAQTRTDSWREIEVELAPQGDVEILDRIESWLLELGARRSTWNSKLGRLLVGRLPPHRVTTDRERPGSAGRVVLDYLRTQAEALRRYDPLVRQDAPDAVHQMRVAARRIRSTLQAFGRVLARDRTRSLTNELKWIGAELSGARDAEVLSQRFTSMLNQLPDDVKLGPVSADIDKAFARRRADARERLLAALGSDRYRAVQDAIDMLLADPPLTRRARRPAKQELPRSILRAYRRVSCTMDEAISLPSGDSRDVALHEARKAAKRLRYAIEAVEPAVGKPATRLRQQLAAVQDLLGEHHDTVIARPVLRELAINAHLDGGNGFTYGILYATETVRAREIEHALPRAWNRLRTPKNTAWLTS